MNTAGGETAGHCSAVRPQTSRPLLGEQQDLAVRFGSIWARGVRAGPPEDVPSDERNWGACGHELLQAQTVPLRSQNIKTGCVASSPVGISVPERAVVPISYMATWTEDRKGLRKGAPTSAHRAPEAPVLRGGSAAQGSGVAGPPPPHPRRHQAEGRERVGARTWEGGSQNMGGWLGDQAR